MGAGEQPAVVPYRPSVATPAELPAPGWPELEAGMQSAKGGDTARNQSSPVTFKLASNDNWAVLIGTDIYDWQRAYDGGTAHSGGDTTLTLKYKLPVSDNVALGAELGVALPTARPPIGSGKVNWGINSIASFDYPGIHVNVNAAGAQLGAVNAGQGPWQGAWAIAASHPLNEQFGITGEVSGIVQRGTSGAGARSRGIELQRKLRAGAGRRRSCGFVTRCARLAIDGRHDRAARSLVLSFWQALLLGTASTEAQRQRAGSEGVCARR